MFKLKPISYNAIKRFPKLYRIQAEKIVEHEVHEAIGTTADAFIIASMLVLIEEFGFGTTQGAKKLTRYIEALQRTIDISSDFYDEAVAFGLRNKLRAHGIEYGMRGGKE